VVNLTDDNSAWEPSSTVNSGTPDSGAKVTTRTAAATTNPTTNNTTSNTASLWSPEKRAGDTVEFPWEDINTPPPPIHVSTNNASQYASSAVQASIERLYTAPKTSSKSVIKSTNKSAIIEVNNSD
jgi:hypothetical protein